MSNDVYANGNAVACKSGDGKVIAAFPDVCLSPPSPPAGPIPVPYPNSSFSKDAQNGSKTVQINGKEVMLKDKSFYATSPLGDEAATRSFGGSVVTHVITGKTYFTAWSMDVKIEGENADRHVDLTLSNCASAIGSPPPGVDLEVFAKTLAEGGICPCCYETLHSDGPIITEAQYYGAEDIIFEHPPGSGNIQVLDSVPRAEYLLKETREGPCKDLLPEPPCNIYQVATADETDNIADKWHSVRPQYQARMGMEQGQSTSHRVPKNAGGCPWGDGNLTPDRPECAKVNTELTQAQADRIAQLRPLWGR